jgi:hypothetical protein
LILLYSRKEYNKQDEEEFIIQKMSSFSDKMIELFTFNDPNIDEANEQKKNFQIFNSIYEIRRSIILHCKPGSYDVWEEIYGNK